MEEDWGNGRWQLQQVQLRQCFWNPRMDTRYSPISHSIFFPNQCSRSQFLQWSTLGSYRWRLDWLPQECACGPSSPNPIWNIPGKNFNNFWFQVWLSCLSAEICAGNLPNLVSGSLASFASAICHCFKLPCASSTSGRVGVGNFHICYINSNSCIYLFHGLLHTLFCNW